MFKKIVFLVLLVALATDVRSKEHKHKHSKSDTTRDMSINVIDENTETKTAGDSINFEKSSLSGPGSLDKDQSETIKTKDEIVKEAEEEITAWINNLNCFKVAMGAMKCYMVKQVSNEYQKNPNRNPIKMKQTITKFVKKLQDLDKVDDELEKLIHKYGGYLYGR